MLEIHKATGGAWGGTEVDKEFFMFLQDVVGNEEWKRYEKEQIEDMLEMQREFEIKKRNFNTVSSGRFVVKVPLSLADAFKRSGRSISGVTARFNETLEWKGDKLRVDASVIKRCFAGPVNKIIEHVQGILSERKMGRVDKIMLVGGFAESQYVQETFKCRFPDKSIIVPAECGLAVLKGAVLFGRNPTVVTSRIARFTYGLNIAIPFDSSKHKKEKLYVSDSGHLCQDSFWKAVEIGQEIKNGFQVSRVGKAANDYQERIKLAVMKSTEKNPVYTTDRGCEVIGTVVIPMDSTLTADDNAVEQIFTFGGTELLFSTIHRTTEAHQELYFDL